LRLLIESNGGSQNYMGRRRQLTFSGDKLLTSFFFFSLASFLFFFSDWDFDSPNSYDYDILLETVTALKQGKTVDVPIYDFETHKR